MWQSGGGGQARRLIGSRKVAGLLPRLSQSAGQNFNRGQRAFFFALGYLGWFAGPWELFASTTAVVIVMWRRQFASTAQRALMIDLPGKIIDKATAPEKAPKSGL